MFVVPGILAGKRVLVIEDEMLVALLIEDFLADFGCVVVKTCNTVAAALEAVQSQAFDVATLDVNLNGERSYLVADLLTEQKNPFLLMTGYGEQAMPSGQGHWKVCTKPFTAEDFAAKLAAVFDVK